MSNWLWVCPGFPSIWKFSWIKTRTSHLSFSLSNWLKTSLKEWLKRCSVPVLCQFRFSLGWPFSCPGCRWLAYEWHLGSFLAPHLDHCGAWKPWIDGLKTLDSKIRRQLKISTGFHDLFCQAIFFSPFLETFDMTWLVSAMTGLQLQTPEPCWSHILSVKAMAESKCFAFAFQLKWLGGEPNTSQGFNAGLALPVGRNPPRISPASAEVFGMASGHINPSLPLARQLVSQGHKVIGGARPQGKSMFRMYQYSRVTIVSVSCSI